MHNAESTHGPSLAVVELASIARGYVALDAAVKRAPVRVGYAAPVSPGRYWFAFEGGEAEVDEALMAALEASREARVDHLWLPNAHPALFAPVFGSDVPRPALMASVGALELATLCAAIRAADAALKCAEVSLVDLHLARGIGGKGYVVLTGDLADVDAAIDAGARAALDESVLFREVIANPDPVVHEVVGPGARRR